MTPPVDWEQLDMIADGFTPDFLEIYQEYLTEIPILLGDLRQKITAGDASQVARSAHQIKGSSANFGFVGVSSPMAVLEQQAKTGSLAGAETLLAEAEEGFKNGLAEVKEKRGV